MYTYIKQIYEKNRNKKSWFDDVGIERKKCKKQLKKKKYFLESSKCKSQ